jgi:hypothetical protein
MMVFARQVEYPLDVTVQRKQKDRPKAVSASSIGISQAEIATLLRR